MGLGKTLQAIEACRLVQAKTVVVICPAILRINWRREFESRYAALPPGSKIPRLEIFSYDSLQNSSTHSRIASIAPYVLLLDEAHYLKNHSAKRTKAVLGKSGLIHKAMHAWALSGTPMPNHPGELWPWLYTVGATTLSISRWMERYCLIRSTPFGQQISGMTRTPSAIQELKALVQANILRRTFAETMPDMPPLIHKTMHIEPLDINPFDWMKFEQLYTRGFVENQFKKQRDALETSIAVYRDMGSTDHDAQQGLLQLTKDTYSLFRRFVGLIKSQVVVDMVQDELAHKIYKQCVIVAWHYDVIKYLLYQFGDKKIKARAIHGSTTPKNRQTWIDEFQKGDGKIQVMILNPAAAGVGITLTASHHVLMVEPDWSPAVNAQAIMRCHRIGQTEPVLVRYFVLNDSVDERIMATVRRKTEDQLKISLADRL
jgi:SNF2 family DNA or RNA helicase